MASVSFTFKFTVSFLGLSTQIEPSFCLFTAVVGTLRTIDLDF